ncbi:MAG: fertility inhibition FinO-like protein [Symploca sp. SIO1B1]|nr:fertility inhibition FinO-like protein [Symploca sp. SIO1B1]
MPTAARMEITLKISEFPADIKTVENGWKEFELDCDGRMVSVKVKPKMYKKLEQARDTYPMWVAAISGKMGEETAKGFILDQPAIQVFEKKPKAPKEPAKEATGAIAN